MSVSVTFGEGCMEVISMLFCRFPFDVVRIIECFLRQPIYDNTQEWFVIQFLGSRAGKARHNGDDKEISELDERRSSSTKVVGDRNGGIFSYRTLFVIKSAEE